MLTDDRIKLLDEDIVLVPRNLVDECQSILCGALATSANDFGAELKACLDTTVLKVCEKQRADYLAMHARYTEQGIKHRLPDGLED